MIVTRRASSYVPKPVIFVLEIENRPVLAFEALSNRDAKEIIRESWFHDDLKRARSNGKPLWDGEAKLRVGVAVGEQVKEIEVLLRAEPDDSEIAIVYLVSLDQA